MSNTDFGDRRFAAERRGEQEWGWRMGPDEMPDFAGDVVYKGEKADDTATHRPAASRQLLLSAGYEGTEYPPA